MITLNSNNIIFTIKDTKLYVFVVTLSARDNLKLSKLLSKRFERSVNWNENKNTTNEYKNFLPMLLAEESVSALENISSQVRKREGLKQWDRRVGISVLEEKFLKINCRRGAPVPDLRVLYQCLSVLIKLRICLHLLKKNGKLYFLHNAK